MARAPEFTRGWLSEAGLAPAMQLLVRAAHQGTLVTYRQVADHLNHSLHLRGVTPHHVGQVVGVLATAVENVEPDAPLINLLVVRGDTHEPGVGADPHLRRRFGVRGRLSNAQRDKLVTEGVLEVWAYPHWPDVYRQVFDENLGVLADTPIDEFDEDGKGDNPRFGGAPESLQHRALKEYVLAHPRQLRIGLKDPVGQVERMLLSGDRMDVEFVEGSRWIGVEVKSLKSGWQDLQRGIYQCVKYLAVMQAQAGFAMTAAECETLLVVERALPPELRALARHHGVGSRVIRVNPV